MKSLQLSWGGGGRGGTYLARVLGQWLKNLVCQCDTVTAANQKLTMVLELSAAGMGASEEEAEAPSLSLRERSNSERESHCHGVNTRALTNARLVLVSEGDPSEVDVGTAGDEKGDRKDFVRCEIAVPTDIGETTHPYQRRQRRFTHKTLSPNGTHSRFHRSKRYAHLAQ